MKSKLIQALSGILSNKVESGKMLDVIKNPYSEGDLLYLKDYLKGFSDWHWERDDNGGIVIQDKDGNVLSEIDPSLVKQFLKLADIRWGWRWKLAASQKKDS